MKVVDAGVIVEMLVGSLTYESLGADELIVPHLADSEVLNVLRTLVRSGKLTEAQGDCAYEAFTKLVLTRYSVDWLHSRIWELRHNLSAYDAAYVALAEALGANALVTTDARLARSPGIGCAVELIR